jgi:hypothetical protein
MDEVGAMSSHRAVQRIVSIFAAAVIALTGLVVVAAPAQADDKLVKVSSWCNRTVTFTNLTSKKVRVEYKSGVPLSPFPDVEGKFTLQPYAKYTLKAPGGNYDSDEGTTHRLYYEAESGDRDQDGYVKQWRYCKGLVTTYPRCGYVKFTNISKYKVRVWYRDGDDYYYWDDYFRLFPYKSKTIEFHARKLAYLAEKGSGDTYRRQFGTVYMPKKCDDYKDDDDDDDDDLFDPDFVGEFILRLIPGANTAEGNTSTN